MEQYKFNGDDWEITTSNDPEIDGYYQDALWAENVVMHTVKRPLTDWDKYTQPWTEDDQIDTLLYISRL
jgi:hypothetical protein